MTLEEAIQYLKLHATTIKLSQDLKLHAAVHLGIEALKFVKDCRVGGTTDPSLLLLGETKE